MAVVGADTHQTLSGVATGDVSLLEEALGLREAQKEANGLDPRTFALVKIAALIALDAPPASYAWQVGNALNDGVSPEDMLAALRAIAPQVGGPKVVAAAPELMLALGLDLPENIELRRTHMFRRRRPLLRAAAVGGGAYALGSHHASRQQQEARQDQRINELRARPRRRPRLRRAGGSARMPWRSSSSSASSTSRACSPTRSSPLRRSDCWP